MKPMNKSGVWRNFSHVVLLLAIHNPAPMIGIDANSVNRFNKPITVLLNLYIFSSLHFLFYTYFAFLLSPLNFKVFLAMICILCEILW